VAVVKRFAEGDASYAEFLRRQDSLAYASSYESAWPAIGEPLYKPQPQGCPSEGEWQSSATAESNMILLVLWIWLCLGTIVILSIETGVIGPFHFGAPPPELPIIRPI
jgi:hypothetical protein